MPRRGKKNKEVVRKIHFSANDDMEIGAFHMASPSLPLIRNAAPSLLAHHTQSVKPMVYDELSEEEKAKYDTRQQEHEERNANRITLDYELAAYASHSLSGSIYHVDGSEAYIDWKWLRNRVLRDEIDKFIIPEGKNSYDMFAIHGGDKWNKFLEQYQDGDEIWLYKNNGFECLAGRAGWVIIRDGKIVTIFRTCMS